MKTKEELEKRAAELNANAEQWENGELGESEQHARVSRYNQIKMLRHVAMRLLQGPGDLYPDACDMPKTTPKSVLDRIERERERQLQLANNIIWVINLMEKRD